MLVPPDPLSGGLGLHGTHGMQGIRDLPLVPSRNELQPAVAKRLSGLHELAKHTPRQVPSHTHPVLNLIIPDPAQHQSQLGIHHISHADIDRPVHHTREKKQSRCQVETVELEESEGVLLQNRAGPVIPRLFEQGHQLPFLLEERLKHRHSSRRLLQHRIPEDNLILHRRRSLSPLRHECLRKACQDLDHPRMVRDLQTKK
mmetsp:Transcript_94453/g.252704  ORF Transcript_94453/g.252704 Transcript_94453/m.252704 type:complete len:201 (+) Transcript_94453:205-807(+)